ncbi:MAG: hypothetical protein ACI8W8_005100, partial [Rhodothermales bacterium]
KDQQHSQAKTSEHVIPHAHEYAIWVSLNFS